ncbi:hypothetical protein SeLEV6574_g07032 [Synchytrium endobioticum]|uniref:Rho-GAP domain-containing protein n=1 Tax=Synchytrium endobioticum TaxID=286115 RepID=A0A507CJC9_9FUNG|nr:hypothetical protein SeLEV6574_g07032 [Synchytrium endobioticum]
MVAPSSRVVEPEVAFEKATASGEEANTWLQEYLFERAEIEKDYSDRLRKLQLRFSGRPFPAPKDGTLTKAWDATLKLARELVEHHRALSEKLTTLGANVADGWGKQYGLTRYLLTNEIKSSNLAYKEKTKIMRSLGDRYNAAGAALEQLKKEDPRNSSKISKAESDLRNADQAYRESVIQLKKEKASYDVAGDAFESVVSDLISSNIEMAHPGRDKDNKYSRRIVRICHCGTNINNKSTNNSQQFVQWPQLSPMSISGPGPRDPTTNQVTSVPLRDLFFNIRLDVAYDRNIPIVLSRCIEAVEARGLEREGIYRVPGKAADKELLTSAFERDEAVVDLTESGPYDVNAIASLVKYYIRQLPEPLFPIDSKDVAEYHRIPEGQKPFWLIQKLQPGPPTHKTRAHQHTMRVLIDHLAKVVEHADMNKMTLVNIATVFAPVIFNTGIEDDSRDTGSRTNLSNIFTRKDGNGLEDKAKEIDTLVLITEDTIRLRHLVFPKLDGAYPHMSISTSSLARRSTASVSSLVGGSSPSLTSAILAATQQPQSSPSTNGVNSPTNNNNPNSNNYSTSNLDTIPARNSPPVPTSASSSQTATYTLSVSAVASIATGTVPSRNGTSQAGAGGKAGAISVSVSPRQSYMTGDTLPSPQSPTS